MSVTAPDPFAYDLQLMREIDGTAEIFPQFTWHGSKPGVPVPGDIWVDSEDGRIWVWHSGTWIEVVSNLD